MFEAWREFYSMRSLTSAASSCRLGLIKDSEGFRTDLHIFPVGYCASFEDPEAGSFISSIEDGDDGQPQFRVSLKGPDGSIQVSTNSWST